MPDAFIRFEQEELRCPKCGGVIPANGIILDSWGQPVLDERGHALWRSTSDLACRACAIGSQMPVKARRYTREDRMREQEKLIDDQTPGIKL